MLNVHFRQVRMSPFQTDQAGSANLSDDPADRLYFLNADQRGQGAGPGGKPSLSTNDAAIQLTRTGASWLGGQPLGSGVTVSFAFRSNAPAAMPGDTAGFSQFSAAQIAATLLALQAWSDAANIRFVRVDDGNGYSDNATLLFSNYSSGENGAAAFAYMPGSSAVGSVSGDVWINNSLSYNASPIQLGYGAHTLVHEIGHAIGLSHPAAYNATKDESITYNQHATYYEDSRQYTVMSYFSESNTGASFYRAYSSAPLLDDIAAIQRLYGANMTTRTGDTVYGFNSNTGQPWFTANNSSIGVIFSVWDAGGVDTLDFSQYSQVQVIDLRQGHFSNVGGMVGNVSIAMGAVIENAIGGSGADVIIGNAANNRLDGGGGSDQIDGGDGIDTAVFNGNRGDFTISATPYGLRVDGATGSVLLNNVEFLAFKDQTISIADAGGVHLSGTDGNDFLTGTRFDDTLKGGYGNDLLIGLEGNDWMYGEGGDDVLIGGPGNNYLFGGDGIDTAIFSGMIGGYDYVTTSSLGGGRYGGSNVYHMERLQFLDGVKSFVSDDLFATAYRLYDAAFDREPDPGGLAAYVHMLANGTTAADILKAFSASAEFQARYGGTDNETYVRRMYQYSLDREPDAGGLAHNVAALNNGMSRAELLTIFSESDEHKNLMKIQIESRGIWIQDEGTLAVARLYDSILDRVPDLGGLEAYRGLLDRGYTLQQLADSMVQSVEFQTRYGNLSNGDFVKQLYRFVLDREADPQGLDVYVSALERGMTRAELTVILSESVEHRASYQSTWENQVRTLENGLYRTPAAEASADAGAPQTLPLADDHFAAQSDDWGHRDAFVLPALVETPLVQPALASDEDYDFQPLTQPLFEQMDLTLTINGPHPDLGLVDHGQHNDWFLAA